jgi:hypothetical protein
MGREQLDDVVRQQREEARRRYSEPPVACPNDGTPVESNGRGELHCRFCGWIWSTSYIRKRRGAAW